MGFLLDFHYSDYWADPGKQIKPAAWVNDDLAAAVTHLHDYTFASIQALVAAGARPTWSRSETRSRLGSSSAQVRASGPDRRRGGPRLRSS